ncbi:MAG: hypothetical protein A2341_28150 [Deltaproteobacteria bacterium RIFOXYB12_FULL_58_9]|nr:MAG: hypothetical protein A2341_28150 [Deltaproteobacteria bacterium RIFOXYB12_FULL_58_9]
MGLWELLSIINKTTLDCEPDEGYKRVERQAERVVNRFANICKKVHERFVPPIVAPVYESRTLSQQEFQRLVTEMQIVTTRIAHLLVSDVIIQKAPEPGDDAVVASWVHRRTEEVLTNYPRAYLLNDDAKKAIGECSVMLIDPYLGLFRGKDIIFIMVAVQKLVEHYQNTAREEFQSEAADPGYGCAPEH